MYKGEDRQQVLAKHRSLAKRRRWLRIFLCVLIAHILATYVPWLFLGFVLLDNEPSVGLEKEEIYRLILAPIIDPVLMFVDFRTFQAAKGHES